jgi:hypothetical protein
MLQVMLLLLLLLLLVVLTLPGAATCGMMQGGWVVHILFVDAQARLGRLLLLRLTIFRSRTQEGWCSKPFSVPQRVVSARVPWVRCSGLLVPPPVLLVLLLLLFLPLLLLSLL